MGTKEAIINVMKTISLNSILLIILFCSILTPAFPEIKKNDTAPKISFRDVDNKLIFVSNELKTKPVLISFFFTSCVPCKREIPELETLYSRYNQTVGMYLISTDAVGSEAVRPYVTRMKITIPVLIDKYPSMVLIGKNGKVLFASYGYNEENIIRLEEALKNFSGRIRELSGSLIL